MLSPLLLVAAAQAFVGLGDDRLACGGSRGVLVDCLLREAGASEPFPFQHDSNELTVLAAVTASEGPVASPPMVALKARPASTNPRVPWDLAFVHHVGYWSHYVASAEHTTWPLPLLTDAAALAAHARERCVLRHAPLEGDLFLLWSPARSEFVRAGIVAHVREPTPPEEGLAAYECVTIEGDSSPTLELRGGTVLRHWRRLSPHRGDRFVRWPALDAGRLDRESAIARGTEPPLLGRAA